MRSCFGSTGEADTHEILLTFTVSVCLRRGFSVGPGHDLVGSKMGNSNTNWQAREEAFHTVIDTWGAASHSIAVHFFVALNIARMSAKLKSGCSSSSS